MERTIDDVVETLRKAQDLGKKCTLLIGAGCSVKAGIPTAEGFVKIIEREFPQAFKRAQVKNYSKCMTELSPGERRDLIARYVDSAKINWAHIAIAQLMKRGYIDRVLTTNFDPLVVRACALVGLYPAIYDFAATQLYKAAYIPEQAIFYLHGQSTGFVLMNTQEECARHSQRLVPVFEDAGNSCIWIVAGYSGENDPVFEHLAQIPQFDYNLYWICCQDEKPGQHVCDRLLKDEKYAFPVLGFDADDFFVAVCQRLDCFPPDFVRSPFAYLDGLLEMIAPYATSSQDAEVDIVNDTRTMIRTAMEYIPMETVSSAYVDLGNNLSKLAKTKGGDDAEWLFKMAYEKYQSAIATKQAIHNTLNRWGVALTEQATPLDDKTAEHLFSLAFEKFQTAILLKPDMHEALNNWGTALSRNAIKKSSRESDSLFAQAYEKFRAAYELCSDDFKLLNNWGSALYKHARIKAMEESVPLLEQAIEKFKEAIEIKPNFSIALSNWGTSISQLAKMKPKSWADKMYDEAFEKYKSALEITPDSEKILINWATTLMSRAQIEATEIAVGMYADALYKLLKAEAILPGCAAYKLAHISAIRNDENACKEWFDEGKKFNKLPLRIDIQKDTAFEKYSNSEWFKKLIESL